MRRDETEGAASEREREQLLFERQMGDALRQSFHDTTAERLPETVHLLLERLEKLVRARGLAE